MIEGGVNPSGTPRSARNSAISLRILYVIVRSIEDERPLNRLWTIFFSRWSVGSWIWVLLLLVLGLQYFQTWYGMQLVRISKEQGLERHLLDLGRLGRQALRGEVLRLADLALDAHFQAMRTERTATNRWRRAELLFQKSLDSYTTASLRRFARSGRLERLLVLSTEGRILHDTEGGDRTFETFGFLAIDRAEFLSALTGRAAASPAYRAGDSPFKRLYLPIQETPQRVGAVLCLVAGRDYLAEIEALAGQVRVANGVVTVLMLLAAWMIYRMVARQRRVEARAAEADRLASVGRLASGFAHELRNPLQIIRAYTEDLQRELHDENHADAAKESCTEIVEEIGRMNRLVEQFLGFSRPPAHPGSGRGSVADALPAAVGMLRPTAERAGVQLALRMSPEKPPPPGGWIVPMDGDTLRQVITNLVLNAIQATRTGGRVAVEAETAGRATLLIRISDEGKGVPEADRQRIFEPFYTTRPGGSGLGLALTLRSVQQAGGRLELLSARPNGGACFELRLPLEDDPPRSETAPTTSGEADAS